MDVEQFFHGGFSPLWDAEVSPLVTRAQCRRFLRNLLELASIQPRRYFRIQKRLARRPAANTNNDPAPTRPLGRSRFIDVVRMRARAAGETAGFDRERRSLARNQTGAGALSEESCYEQYRYQESRYNKYHRHEFNNATQDLQVEF
jgi:hypothetical protein